MTQTANSQSDVNNRSTWVLETTECKRPSRIEEALTASLYVSCDSEGTGGDGQAWKTWCQEFLSEAVSFVPEDTTVLDRLFEALGITSACTVLGEFSAEEEYWVNTPSGGGIYWTSIKDELFVFSADVIAAAVASAPLYSYEDDEH